MALVVKDLQLRFAREHLHWTLLLRGGGVFIYRWGKNIFEGPERRRHRVWWRQEERFVGVCISVREPFGGDSVMSWGGVSFDACMELVAIPRRALVVEDLLKTTYTV